MKKDELEAFRSQLLKIEKHLRADIAGLTDEALQKTDGKGTGNLSNVPVENHAELGSDNYCAEVTIGLLENSSARVEEISDALDRIDNGTFGNCTDCGKLISSKRLQSIPFVRQCIKCARATQKGESIARGNL